MKTPIDLLHDRSGATSIEYGLVAALVSVAVIGSLGDLGSSVSTLFGVVTHVNNVASSLGGT
jgi:pilus assembly protein Flp/PilA